MTTQAVSSSIDEQPIPRVHGGAPPLARPALPTAAPREAGGIARVIEAADRSRKNNFDFLRFLLAGLVVYSHSFLLLLGHTAAYARAEPFSRLTGGKLNGGELAVDGFFAISGFLIVQSWLRSGSVWLYLRKRIARIYPAFLVSAAFCLLLVGSLSLESSRATVAPAPLARYVGSTLALCKIDLPGGFAHNPASGVNESTWTILPEFFCYLLVALLGWLGTYRRPIVLLALTCVFIGLFGVQRVAHPALLNEKAEITWLPVLYKGQWPRFLSFFLLGMCFHFYRERLRFSRPAVLAALVLLLGSVLLRHGILLALPTCGLYLLFALAFAPIARLNRFARSGDFSYGIYLYSYPVQQTIVAFGKPYLTPYSLFALAFPVSCLLAAASWHWVEKPFLQRKPR
jgi:peptidoglycan/LPS O-acetylase OafA/YrhL